MATTATTPVPATTARTETNRTLNLRNPLPLSAAQEQEVRNIYYRRVRDHCAQEIKEFAACALGRTVTVSFVCRQQRQAMNSCMISHATRKEEDLAREEWFAGRDERQRKRQEELDAVEKRREEVIRLQRTWEVRAKQEEEAKEGMRVGKTGQWESTKEQERGKTWR